MLKEKTDVVLRAIESEDGEWIKKLLSEHWGSSLVVTRGVSHNAEELPGFAIIQGKDPKALVTFREDRTDIEIITLNSLQEGQGYGTALLNAVEGYARENGFRRIWLITTNDNTKALRFYQKSGFTLAGLYPRAIERSRKIKPEIPDMGNDGIPIRDEILLEYTLEDKHLE
ncbi:GNAT family N-acetyltransferase [bacterium]|nr:GNAT family N-acetyltransferase [candidate division CSSED10-310 bacterium]